MRCRFNQYCLFQIYMLHAKYLSCTWDICSVFLNTCAVYQIYLRAVFENMMRFSKYIFYFILWIYVWIGIQKYMVCELGLRGLRNYSIWKTKHFFGIKFSFSIDHILFTIMDDRERNRQGFTSFLDALQSVLMNIQNLHEIEKMHHIFEYST